jgi:hypothetical protein
MKTKILLLATFITFGFQVFSQTKPFRFGLKVAPNIGWISPDTEDYESDGASAGFSWGFISDITIIENYYFGTGFNVSYINGKLSFPDSLKLTNDDFQTFGTTSRTYHFRYIDVPLTLKMKTSKFDKLQVYGQIGFSLGFNLKAKAQDTFTYLDGNVYKTEENESDISDEVTFLKGALVLGAGIDYFIDPSTSILVGITYSNGISNVLKGWNEVNLADQKAIPSYIELTLGVIF